MNSTNVIFVSTACLPGIQPLKKRVADYQQHGLSNIELGAGVTVSEDWLFRILHNDGCFLIHNYFPPPVESFVLNLASPDEMVRRRSLDVVCQAIHLTAELKAPFYSVHAGFITDPIGFGTTNFVFPDPASPTEKELAFGRFVESLKIALDVADKCDIDLLVENNVCTDDLKGKLLLQTAEEFQELFQAISSSNLLVLLDTGHLNVTAHTFNFHQTAFVEQIAPFVGAFHIHDNDGTSDFHRPPLPDSWIINVLKQEKFRGLPIVVEAKFTTPGQLYSYVTWMGEELGIANH